MARLAAVDPVMAALMARVGPIQLKARRLPPFESLTNAILHQQLSGKAAGTIRDRLLGLFGNRFPEPQQVLDTDPERLRGVGLSRPKVSYLRDLAERSVTGHVPGLAQCDRMTEEELIRVLTEVKGVGRWTVEMLLIFNLGREDVLPVDDLGVRRGFKVAYGKRSMPDPRALARFGTVWAPLRSYAALYLWRAADTTE